MNAPSEVFWRLIPNVRSRERSRALFFIALLTLLTVAQTLGLAGSEALLLAQLGPSWLPVSFIGASLTTVVGSFLYAARVGESRNDRLFVQMLLGASLVLTACAWGAARGYSLIFPLLFCLYYLSQAVFLNHFWTFSGDYFDTLTSKRLFPVFTVGASIGGLLGGLAVIPIVRLAEPEALILAWAGFFAASALLLWAARRPLRRWGPLALEEADETSVEGMRGAVRYLGGSSLGRWLVLSAIGMVLAIFVAQYLYSEIFAASFPETSDLAVFFGLYLAVTNLIEIALELAVVPRLIHRLGVPTVHLLHPILTLGSLGALAFQYGLGSALAARVNRELIENAVAQPVRTLVYNALPPRFRGRIRAFLEGIVVYAGMSGAGLLLLLIGSPDPRWLCAAGAAAATLYLAANLRARSEYMRSLVEGIRAGRLELADLDEEIGNWEASRLAALFEQMLREDGERASRPLRQIVPSLAQRGIVEPLLRGVGHPGAEVRRACVEALAGLDDPEVEAVLESALRDADASVRRSAVRGVEQASETTRRRLARRVRALVEDPDPAVRAAAASLAEAQGLEVLRRMLGSAERDEVLAALRVAGSELGPEVAARTGDADPELRAAALDRVSEVAPDVIPEASELGSALADPHPEVRRAAVSALARRPTLDELAPVVAALADPSPGVQQTAIAALEARGEQGMHLALPLLDDERERAVEGALRVLSTSGSSDAKAILSAELLRRARGTWYAQIAYETVPQGDELALRFLRAAWQDAIRRLSRQAFLVLELLENERVILRVQKALRFGSTRARGDALEVLSNLGEREAAHLMVLFHENSPLDERIHLARAMVGVPGDPEALVEASRRHPVRWIRMGAEALAVSEDARPKEAETMERLLALERVELFSNLSLEQLEAIQNLAREVSFLADEVIVRQGDPGGELYLLLEGEVEVFLDYDTPHPKSRARLSPVSYFGEMAIFDDRERAATVVATQPCRLLVLEGQSLKELLLQMPDISFTFLRVLTARVRAAEQELRLRQERQRELEQELAQRQ